VNSKQVIVLFCTILAAAIISVSIGMEAKDRPDCPEAVSPAPPGIERGSILVYADDSSRCYWLPTWCADSIARLNERLKFWLDDGTLWMVDDTLN